MIKEKCPMTGSGIYPFPRDMSHPLDPAPQVVALRHEAPISKVSLWNGREAWLVTRLDDARTVLSDRRFSSVPAHENYPTLSAGVQTTKRSDTSFLRRDPPEHTEHRRMWQPFFGAGNVNALRPAVQRYVDEAIDDLIANGAPADFVKYVALPIPSRVISQLLAVPDEDHHFFQSHSAVRGRINATPAEIEAANKALSGYWRKMTEERLANPGDDLVSKLIVKEVREGKITVDDVVVMAQLMLFAGHDTTANMIGLSTLTLLQHPEAIDAIKADPAATPRIVEELLRYLTIVHNGLQRVALADIEVGGVTIRNGEGVIIHLASANRDEMVFANPDQFDGSRQMKPHVAFGAGFHACIGAPLARMEMQVVFDTLFMRLPDLRLAVPLEEIRYKTDNLFYGAVALPLAW